MSLLQKSEDLSRGLTSAVSPLQASASSAVELFGEEGSPRSTQSFEAAFPRYAPNLEHAEFCKKRAPRMYSAE